MIGSGEVIENYPEDKPFASALLFGICKNQILHVVIAYDDSNQNVFVVIAYWPDKEHFELDFKTRRKT